jgi:hypothetical protein
VPDEGIAGLEGALLALETIVLDLLVVLIVFYVVLAIVLWLGSQSLQRFFYTEPSPGLLWRAALVSGLLTGFWWLWTLLNIWSSTVIPIEGRVEIAYGMPWDFSTRVDVVAEPVAQIVSKRRTSEPALYKLDKLSPREIRYKKQDGDEYWDAAGVEYVKFSHAGQDFHFVRVRMPEETYAAFVDEITGLVMREYEIGRVGYSSPERLVIYILLNCAHLALWILCVWLGLRFEFVHALGVAVLLWAMSTMAVLPTLCAQAAEILAVS